MNIVLNLDDFTITHNRLDVLLKLKNHFPKFKVSLFTIPIDHSMDYGPYQIRKQSLIEIKKNLDWMQLIPHGLEHSWSKEISSMNYDEFKNVTIPAIEMAFAKDELPFEKGFKAPHYRWNEGVVRVLDELGWWSAIKRDSLLKTKKFYEFDYALNEPFWESDKNTLRLNGHLYGCPDDIGICFDNLLKLPQDSNFYYVTDYLHDSTI